MSSHRSVHRHFLLACGLTFLWLPLHGMAQHGAETSATDEQPAALLAMAAVGPTLVAGITSPTNPVPAGTVELPPDLARAIKEYDQATFRNDIVVLGDLVAEDYMLVNSDSTLQDKQSYLADFTVPGFRLNPYVMEEPVLKLWGNTALTAGRLHLTWTQDDRRHNRLVRVAHIWTKDEGHWRLRYTQLTRVT